jgi:hypothetical protein
MSIINAAWYLQGDPNILDNITRILYYSLALRWGDGENSINFRE